MAMNTFVARNELICALLARGFTEAPAGDGTGWRYTHTDGFNLWFNAGGRFQLTLPGGRRNPGVADQPSDILDIIDVEASKL